MLKTNYFLQHIKRTPKLKLLSLTLNTTKSVSYYNNLTKLQYSLFTTKNIILFNNLETDVINKEIKEIKEEIKKDEPNSYFEGFGLKKEVIECIQQDLGWKYPTTVQRKVLELLETKRNIVASAWTGQGKTGAYMLPVINNILEARDLNKNIEIEDADRVDIHYLRPKAIIMVPSSELAKQVYNEFNKVGKRLKINCGLIINEKEVKEQLDLLPKDLDIIICTPGRMLQHLIYSFEQEKSNFKDYSLNIDNNNNNNNNIIKKNYLSFTRVINFIIDECDKLLSLGYLPEVLKCWEYISKPTLNSRISKIQTIVLSATIVQEVHGFVMKVAKHFKLIDLNMNMGIPKTVQQIRYDIQNQRKSSLLFYFLRRKGKVSLKNKKVLIFVRTIQRCNRLTDQLLNQNYKVGNLHSSISLKQRTLILNKFQNGELDLLVATDIATRGLDLPNLDVVINFDVPHIPQDYIHRVGRCGRMGKAGLAITFVGKDKEVIQRSNSIDSIRDETELFEKIEQLLELSKNDPNCSKLETRKIPGPFLDIEQFSKLKKVVKDSRFKLLINNVNLNHQKDKKLNLKENINGVKYDQLMKRFNELDAKKKGLKISKKDKMANLHAN